MSKVCQHKSSHLYKRHQEYVGDAYLNYQVKFKLVELYPNTPIKLIGQNQGYFVRNNLLSSFGEINKIGNANHVEILIGKYCMENNFEKANELIDKYMAFIIKRLKLDIMLNKEFEPFTFYQFNNFHVKLFKKQLNFKFKPLNYV